MSNRLTAAERRARDRRIVELARDGTRPAAIAERLGIPVGVVSVALKAARRTDPSVPRFISGPPAGAARAKAAPRKAESPTARLDEAFAAAPAAADVMTPADLRRLADLWRGGTTDLTRLAALLRKRYALIADAIVRTGLSRAGRVRIARVAGETDTPGEAMP